MQTPLGKIAVPSQPSVSFVEAPKEGTSTSDSRLFAARFSGWLRAFPFLLFPVKDQEIPWRKHFDSLTQFGRKMRVIACNQAYRLTGIGNFTKWLVAWVRQRVGKWRRSHNLTTPL